MCVIVPKTHSNGPVSQLSVSCTGRYLTLIRQLLCEVLGISTLSACPLCGGSVWGKISTASRWLPHTYPSLSHAFFSLHDSANTRTIGGLLTDSVMKIPRMAYAWIWSKRQVLAHLNEARLV